MTNLRGGKPVAPKRLLRDQRKKKYRKRPASDNVYLFQDEPSSSDEEVVETTPVNTPEMPPPRTAPPAVPRHYVQQHEPLTPTTVIEVKRQRLEEKLEQVEPQVVCRG